MPEIRLPEEGKGNVVHIADPRIPSGPLHLQFYEGFPTIGDEGEIAPEWITGELPHRLGYEVETPAGKDPLPVRTVNWLEADGDTVTITSTLTNAGEVIVDEIKLNPCLAFRKCSEMFDDTGERLFFRCGGEWKNWRELRRYVNVGWHEKVQHFEVSGRPSRVPYYADGYNRAKWGTSPDRIDVSLAARVHPTSGLAIAIAMDRSYDAAGNCNPTHYCIHSSGVISDLCPGETRTRIGKIFFCEGGLKEVWKRFNDELTSVI